MAIAQTAIQKHITPFGIYVYPFGPIYDSKFQILFILKTWYLMVQQMANQLHI